MPRDARRRFNPNELTGLPPERAAQLVFDWWCHDADRKAWLDWLDGKVALIHGRAPVQDDPAPPRSQPAPQGHAVVAVISDAKDVRNALTRPAEFSNIPYAELGGASFMLAIDPSPPGIQPDWHARQRQAASVALATLSAAHLPRAAELAVREAALLSLRAARFDLAEFAAQSALRYVGRLFGYAERDHPLLEEAALCGYRALQYVIVGRHFVSEPGTLPAAQQALARLATRTSALMHEYAQRARSPRRPLPPGQHRADATWPDGVQPWSEVGLSSVGEPVLRTLPAHAGELNGGDLCNLVGGLLVGTVGNVQTALCGIVHALLCSQPEKRQRERLRALPLADLAAEIDRELARHPPVPFLPRRTRSAGPVAVKGGSIPAGTDCIVVLRGTGPDGCPHAYAWGESGDAAKPAPHECLGRAFIKPLLAELLHATLNLPGLDHCFDALTGERLDPERLWGFGVSRFPLRHDREKRVVQQPLIVVMPLKSPQAEHAERLRRVIRAGVPRIQWALDHSRHVHVAWFELTDDGRSLALRTIYDGDFDAYIEHFALKVGDLFDLLFESIEGAPPMPVAEHPDAFVETIRRFNRTPLGGYFYSAYPRHEVAHILRQPEAAP